MNSVDLGIWRKLTKLVIGLVVLAILLLIIMCYRPLIAENERMRRDILQKDEQIKKEQRLALEYSNEINVLRNDPKTVERLTREKLGYSKPDETVIYFENSPSNSPKSH